MAGETRVTGFRRLLQNRRLRHGGAFLFSGTTAFLVDACVTLALVWLLGMNKFLARLVAILLAQTVSWALHRTFTFAVTARPSFAEIMRFAAVAWGANALNYLVYAGVLLLLPKTPVLLALIVGSFTAMVFSYLGYRFGVFRRIAFGGDA
jgi:putative flippase GtrA